MPFAMSGSQVGAVVLGSALFLMALALFAIGVWSRRWPKTTGTIKISIHDREWEGEKDGTSFTLKRADKLYLAYAYELGGREYLASSIKPNGDFGGGADQSRWYGEGKKVTVYFCPFRPQWCCLEPGGMIMPLAVLFASIVMFSLAFPQA